MVLCSPKWTQRNAPHICPSPQRKSGGTPLTAHGSEAAGQCHGSSGKKVSSGRRTNKTLFVQVSEIINSKEVSCAPIVQGANLVLSCQTICWCASMNRTGMMRDRRGRWWSLGWTRLPLPTEKIWLWFVALTYFFLFPFSSHNTTHAYHQFTL